MNTKLMILAAGIAAASYLPAQSYAPPRRISINGVVLSPDDLNTIETIERGYNFRIADGGYWYDRRSGAIGGLNGPTAGFLPAGLRIGGAMQANCSGGGTNVFVNGREIHPADLMKLSQLGPVLPGRYWVEANGDFGYEGGPRAGNLVMLAQEAYARAGMQLNQNGGRAKYAMDGIHTGPGYYLERGGGSATRY